MNCAQARDVIPDFAFGALDSNTQVELREHLGRCRACSAELRTLTATLNALDAMPTPKPSPRVRRSVHAAIEHEKLVLAGAVASPAFTPAAAKPARRRSVLFWILQPLAACALVAAGFFAGHTPSAPAPVPTAAAAAKPDLATQQQIADLQAKVDAMTQMVGYSLAKNSTNDRIAKVLTTAATVKPGEQVIDNLITTMSLDPSANVRLNAVEALYAHADNLVVKAAVVASLTHETSPLVQIALIDFAVGAHDHEAVPELQKLVAADQTDPNVRDAAKNAIPQL